MHIERACVAIVTITPHLIEQLLSGDYSILFLCQSGKQKKFFMRQSYVCTITGCAHILEIDRQSSIMVPFRDVFFSSAQDRANAAFSDRKP